VPISAALCQGLHINVVTVASRWQRVGDLIGSEFESHTSSNKGRRLTSCASWPVEDIKQNIKRFLVVQNLKIAESSVFMSVEKFRENEYATFSNF